MYTDPIADLLTRIRNASKANVSVVTIPYSKLKEEILKIMQASGFVEKYEKSKEALAELTITLKENRPLTLTRVSRPGQRIYLGKETMKPHRSGLGIAIVSTSKGLMTSEKAKKEGIGGEMICEIY